VSPDGPVVNNNGEANRLARYTVKDVARLSGVSVRALHHYDAIGLLKPACVGDNGYRYYGREELLRLQQILFHRELGMALDAIAGLLDAPGFDRAAALRAHRDALAAEAHRYRRLVRTIDETLAELDGETTMDDKAMYRGFSPEKQAEHEAWLVENYGEAMRPLIAAAKQKMAGFSQGQFDTFQAEAQDIDARMARAMTEGLPADSSAAIDQMRRLHAWVAKSWTSPPTAEAFERLGRMYLENPELRARYDGRAAGLAEYMAAAMTAFAARGLG
jgi:DNA-binding transcriptional MerR regulator